MTKKIMAGWTAAMVLAATGTLAAHHSLSQMDTQTAVTVKGTIVLFERINPHSFIFVDQMGKDGQMHRWAIEGPAINQLDRLQIGKDTFKVGDPLEACGYASYKGVESQRTVNTEPISLSLKDKTPKSMSGQVLTAEVLIMPDGRKQPWSDYGHHKCLGPDYKDIHTSR